MKTLFLITTALLVFLSSFAPGTVWNANAAKARITFSIDGPFGKVKGSLGGLKAVVVLDDKNLGAASITASVEVSTIETGIDLRNRDLLTQAEWFQADKYPRISFRSTLFQKTKNGYKVTGDLTIKEATKSVDIPFIFTKSKTNGLLKGNLTINREDYGLGANNTVGKVIAILIEVPVKK